MMKKEQGRSPRKQRTLALTRTIPLRSRPLTAPGSATHRPSAEANIRVVVRVRPPNTKELGDNHRNVIKVVDDQMLIFDPEEENQPFFYHGVKQRGRDLLKKANKNMQFLFNRVFGFEASNELVFEHSTKDLICTLMDGYNCSVFAYGATGAGKTHTMLGHNRNPGITFLTIAELFRQKEQLQSERDFELAATYLEVYNENVLDLLNPGAALHLREDGKYGVIVAGNQVKRIERPDDLFDLLEKGNKNRTQHPTDANAESSRSHAVFQVYVKMNIRSTGSVRIAKLSMIDLAGSERGAATGCAGARFTEGANINKSLLALGNCINSLADGNKHIPYRDSKLTRLLKDSLGGNCHTVMIANISPSSLTYEDTYNTLKYATRAKKIKTVLKKNVISCEMHLGKYKELYDEIKKENENLKLQLEELENKLKTQTEHCGGAGDGPPVAIGTPRSPHQVPDIHKNKLMQLYKERIRILQQIYDSQIKEQLLTIKKKLKRDAYSRLSGLCDSSAEKAKGHRRLGGTVTRLEKQKDDLKTEIVMLKNKQNEIDEQIQALVKEHPGLKSFVETESLRLELAEVNKKNEFSEVVNRLQQEEIDNRGDLMTHMAEVLKPCYMLLRGNRMVPDDIVKKYRALVRQLQGIGHVQWTDDCHDSGFSTTTIVSSNTSPGTPLIQTDDENLSTPSRLRGKRKHSESTSPLDSTFVLPPVTTKTICADQLLTKVYLTPNKNTLPNKSTATPVSAENYLFKLYEPPPAKKPLHLRSHSPYRKCKENKPIGTMGTSQRFPPGHKARVMPNKKQIIIKGKPLASSNRLPQIANNLNKYEK